MPLFQRKTKSRDLQGLGLEELLFEAETSTDPRVKHQALTLAEQISPDHLEVQRQLLLLGRLHERNPRQVDFRVIKSYLLHAFEHPEQHSQTEQQDMARELFNDPRLLRCLALAPNPDAFLNEYLDDLSRDYLRIFVAGDNRHIPRVFGISFKGSMARYLAVPVRDLLVNVLASPWLSETEAALLAKAFYKAFFQHTQGEVQQLDKLLGAEVRALLR